MKKKLLLVLFLLSNILLTGCFDLGTFGGNGAYNDADPDDIDEYYKDYFEAFGDIKMFKQNKFSKNYSLKGSFFSKSTINELTWENDDYKVDYDEYIYMAIKVEKNLNIDSLSLYVKEDESMLSEETLQIYLYVQNTSIFSSVPSYNELLYNTEDGKPITFAYLKKEDALANTSVTINNSSFESFSIETFKDGADTLYVEEGQYIILSFYNNTAYGRVEEMNIISFTALNLLIRAI